MASTMLWPMPWANTPAKGMFERSSCWRRVLTGARGYGCKVRPTGQHCVGMVRTWRDMDGEFEVPDRAY